MLVALKSLFVSVRENLTLVLISLATVFLFTVLLFFLEHYFTKKRQEVRVSKTTYMTTVALLSAVAGILMLFEFPLPFLAPGFYKMDLSEVPVVVGAFALGPVAGVVIEFVKIMINLAMNGTTSAFIGEIANFSIGVGFVVPASVIYFTNRSKKREIAGLIFGTVFTTAVGVFLNAYVLLPFYAGAFGGMEKIVAAGTAVNANIDSVLTFCLFAVAPFNIVKFSIVSLITASLFGSLKNVIARKH